MRYRIPSVLRETMIDFTIGYLLERPQPNVTEYGYQFFLRLKTERDGPGADATQPEGTEGEPPLVDAKRSKPDNETGGVASTKVQGNPDLPAYIDKPMFRDHMVPKAATLISRMGAGEVFSLNENDATWIYQMAAKYMLEAPTDFVEWGLEYCDNERLRWSYAEKDNK